MKPDIDGLLFGADSEVLYNCALNCEGNAIEIGSFRGASTILLAQGLKDGSGGRLISIDPYDNRYIETGFPGSGLSIRLFNRYNHWVRDRNLKKYGVDNVKLFTACSYDIANWFNNSTVGLLFIDGDHTYPAVKTDLQLYIPKLKSGGILIMHDRYLDGVTRAIREEINDEQFKQKPLPVSGLMALIAIKR